MADSNLKLKFKDLKLKPAENLDFGDYSSNIAFDLAKKLKKSPEEAALQLKKALEKNATLKKKFEKIEAVRGFLNFLLSKKTLIDNLKEILKKENNYGSASVKKQEINLEFISANPTSPLTVGNGRGGFFGDALGNILEKAGCSVTKEYYINDAKVSKQIQELGKTFLGKGTSYLTPFLEKLIKESKKEISIDSEAEAGFYLAQKIQKINQDFIKKKLKINFDVWSTEDDLYESGKVDKILNTLKKKDAVYKKEGALWLKTSQFGEKKDWVVVRSDGSPDYLLSDIAYHQDKFNRGFDLAIDIVGADHQAHKYKMEAAARIMDWPDVKILISQLVTLKGKEKMSKRKGQYIALEELIDTVGLDAARWFFLEKALGTHMEFDLELARQKSKENPVYYIQYAHARTANIIKKSKVQFESQNLLNKFNDLDWMLIRKIRVFPELIEEVAQSYEVHKICHWLLALARFFHSYYQENRVISEDKNLTQARLALIKATKVVFKNALGLLGINAPEKM